MIPGSRLLNADATVEISGVSKDTRTIQPGALYAPIIGERFDGHDFVGQAFSGGAAASLWQSDRPLPEAAAAEGRPLLVVENVLAAVQQLANAYRRQTGVKVVGVTGSNGKSTTKEMIYAALAATFKSHKTDKNLNTEIGLPFTLLEMAEDTQVVVLEMGMRGRGQIAELAAIAEPDIAVITNVGEAHVELLGSREEIARAKTEILSGLKDGGLFVVNGDDPIVDRVLPEMPKPSQMATCRFGSKSTNDLYPLDIRIELGGSRFAASDEPGYRYRIPLLGRHHVANALAAIAVAKHLGVACEAIAAGLAGLKLFGMRSEFTRLPGGATIFDDTYNASPLSTRAAIDLLRELTGFTRKAVVLGDMLELGETADLYHREIGGLLHPEEIAVVYTYGELARAIAEEADKRYPPGCVKSYTDMERMSQDIAFELKAGDIVLLKGSRGMKLDQAVEYLLANG
jgi:UDP-N-acetylmuramoyl-tripeptide--D-alanyl-D-alanine ligase